MDLAVIFDGIGSQIIGVVVGALLSALFCVPVGYKAGAKSVRQKQISGNGSTQIQVGDFDGR